MTELLLYLYAESPLHPGGSDSVDALDLPVQREVTTGYPVIWGQSLKGALREAAGDKLRETGDDEPHVNKVFGSPPPREGNREATTAGLLAVGDAQLVAMPVPTLQHTFAWATSALALNRLSRRYRTLALQRPVPAVPDVGAGEGIAGSGGWLGESPTRHAFGPCLVDFPASTSDADLSAWAERIAVDALGGVDGPAGYFARKLCTDLILFGEDVLPTLLTECTETVARVQLGTDKTVQNGPFYSEYLPAETILAASLTLRPSSNSEAHLQMLRAVLHNTLIRLGGDETIGKGLVWTRLVESEVA